jgi:iron complex transport system ATP-binding protein
MTLTAAGISVALGLRTVLSDVSFALAGGEVTAIVGPNGAGKSTCLRALAGLLPISRGAVMFDGQPVEQMPANDRARAIGYLPQQRIVHWPLTVARTVALGRVPHGGGGATDVAAVDRAMDEMDVARFRDRPTTELSGGELARVLMARVLAQETPVILADEPTAGLDPAHQLALLDRLAALTRAGRTVAVAMHDLTLAARYCRRIILLKDGRVLGDGAPAAVLTAPLLKSAFGIEARLEHIDGLPVVLTAGLC